MRKFIYTIVVLIIIVVAAFLVSPYFIGSSAESTLHKQIAIFNKEVPYISITSSDYQRKWFDSNAKIKITFHPPQGSGLPQDFRKSITLDAVIKHGPVFKITDDAGHSSFHFGRGALLIQGTSPSFQGDIEAILSASNNIDLTADIKKIVFHDKDGTAYTLSNLTFDTKDGTNNNQIHTLDINHILVEAPKAGSVNMENVNLTADGHTDDNIWLGNGNFSIRSIVVSAKAGEVSQPMGNIDNLSLHYDTDLTADNTKLNSSMTFNIASATIMGKTIKPATIEYSVNGIDAKAYNELLNAIKEIEPNGDISHISTAQILSIAKPAFDVIQPGFNLKLNKLYVGLPKEIAPVPISAHATITLKPLGDLFNKIITPMLQAQADSKGADKQALQMKMMSSLPMLMGSLTRAVEADGAIHIPTTLVKLALTEKYTGTLAHMAARGMQVTQTPQQLVQQAYDYLTQSKMLIPDEKGESNTLAFTFKDGLLLINGQHPALKLPRPTQATAAPPKIEAQPTPHPASLDASVIVPPPPAAAAPKTPPTPATHTETQTQQVAH